jgi:uncharacterized metal-binding protein
MVILLFTASFLLSLAVSYVISKLFRESAEGFLSRFFARPLSAAAAKYLQFVIVFVGVTSGTRIHLLEDYIDAPPWNRPDLAAQLTQEVWALSIYHTLVDLLYGIVWLLVVFAFLALAALFYLRRSNMTSLLAKPEPEGATEETRPLATNR